jgi:hypothetical protein
LAVLLHFRQGHAFVELVELVFVGLLVDDSLINEGVEELVFAALQLDELALGGGSLGRDVLSSGLPDVEDDSPEEGYQLRTRTEVLQEAEKFGLQLVPRNVGAAAAGFGRTVVVGVAPPGFALGPGAGEGLVRCRRVPGLGG